MNFYLKTLESSLRERIAFFENASLEKEAAELKSRLEKILLRNGTSQADKKQLDESCEIANAVGANSSAAADGISRLKEKLADKKSEIPQLEKNSLLSKLENAATLSSLRPLRIAYIERILSIRRAKKTEPPAQNINQAGPYNNSKTLNEALQLIYAQDPLWLEDLKKLYSPIISNKTL